MKPRMIWTTALAGIMSLSTLGVFYNGAEALDLGDFTGAERATITKEAPKHGGAILIKEDIVYPQPQARAVIAQPMTVVAKGRMQPILTGDPSMTMVSSNARSAAYLNSVTPAAGGSVDGSTGQPGKGIDNKFDVTTAPGNAYDQFKARVTVAGNASPPVDGKPLTTTTTAEGDRVKSLNDIVPAAGGDIAYRTDVGGKSSVQAMTGRGNGNGYNN